MRKAFIILTGILSALLLATCKQFTTDIDDYLGYWSAEAYITDSSIKAVVQNDVNSIASVPSAEDVPITFTLQNPKSFPLDLPPEADAEKNVIVFEHLPKAPVAGRDYTLTQSEDRQSLLLTYKASFLQAHEWGEQDLSSVLTLYATDGRKFKQTYTSTVKANTPPPKPSFTVVKTKGSPAYYVLCIMAPGMDKKVPGGLLHKDLARVEINETSYSFSVNEAQTAFTKPEGDVFITRSEVEKLTEPGADDVPAGGWVLYYKTDVEVKDGAVKKEYTVRLADAQGLVSDILNASTKPNKAEAEQVRITKGTVSGSGNGDADNPVIIGTDSSGAELSVSSATANTTVHCTVSEIGGSTPVKYDGNPVTVPLPLNGAGEKQYKLEYYTDGEGFAATAVKTIYYKVVQGHTVIFDANRGAYPDGAAVVSKTALHGTTISPPDPLPTRDGYGVTGWYKSADGSGAAWNFDMDTVTGDIRLYAKWTAGVVSYTVEHYQEKLDGTYPDTAQDIDTGLIGTTDASISADSIKKNYPGFEYDYMNPADPKIGADGSTVVKVYYKRKTYAVNFNVDGSSGGSISVTAVGGSVSGSSVTVKYGGSVTFTANPDTVNGYEVEKWTVGGSVIPNHTSTTYRLSNIDGNKNVTVTFKKKFDVTFSVGYGQGGSLKCTYNGTHETSGMQTIHVWEGDSVEFTAEPDAANGWEVQSWMVDSVIVPGQTSENYTLSNVTGPKTVTVIFKKKTYTVTFSVANGEGKLNGVYGSQNNTAENGHGEVTLTNVPHKTQVPFTATPKYGWEVEGWTASAGTLSGGGTDTTATLKVTDNATVTVKFKKITTVNGGDGAWKLLKKVVEIADPNSTITIDGKIEASSGNSGQIKIDKTLTIRGKTVAGNILDANGLSRIFKVENGATLFLENLTLKGGKADEAEDADKCGGAIYASNAIVNITDCTITGNKATTNGGGIYVEGGTTNITNCIFTGNTAKNGGGIYMTDRSYPVVIISGGTIGGTGPNEANKATGTDGNGGGIYVGYLCDLRLNSALLITSNKAAKGGGVYANYADVSMKEGTRIAVDEVNNDVYLDNTSKIKVFNTLTAPPPVARITVPDDKYYPTTQVLEAGTGVNLASEAGKFSVTPKSGTPPEYWGINNTGNLTQDKTSTFNAVSNDQIKAAESSMTATKIIDRKANLLGKLVLYKTSEGNYGIMHVTAVDNTGVGYIRIDYKTFNSDGSIKKSENNKKVNGAWPFDLDEGKDLGGDFDFWLENLNSTDAGRLFKPANGAKFYILPN